MGFSLASACQLPTENGTFEMRVYSDSDYVSDVVAIVARVSHGAPRLRQEGGADSVLATAPQSILLRVHDQCATSEVFGSLKCDCRLQLDASLRAMHAAAVSAYDSTAPVAPGTDPLRIVGVLVYLPQEGRGIGLASKVAAYALQEALQEGDETVAAASVAISSGATGGAPPPPQRGLDTVDANRALGLPDDSRHYGAVPRVLSDLGLVTAAASPPGGWGLAPGTLPLALLTNSPRKAEALAALGLPVAARLPCLVQVSSPLASAYLRAKAERMGHDIPERFLLRPPPPVVAVGGGGEGGAPAAALAPTGGGKGP